MGGMVVYYLIAVIYSQLKLAIMIIKYFLNRHNDLWRMSPPNSSGCIFPLFVQMMRILAAKLAFLATTTTSNRQHYSSYK